MKATVFILPHGRSEVIDLKNIRPEDEAYFTERGIHISLEQLNGEMVVYADLGKPNKDGDPEELIEFSHGRNCQDTLSALRRLCEEHLA